MYDLESFKINNLLSLCVKIAAVLENPPPLDGQMVRQDGAKARLLRLNKACAKTVEAIPAQ